MITDGRGIDAEYVHDSCPADLKPYEKAYEMKIKNLDTMVHSWVGSYGISAQVFAVDHCFSKKARSKYIEKPVFANLNDGNGYSESNEEIAVFEMKQRTKILEKQGLPKSPM